MTQKRLFTVFIDGLKPESLRYMPFVSSIGEVRRMRTELGYSPTCYASMYSGVYPNKHRLWFSWWYSPDTSPYKWLHNLKIDRLPHNLVTRYLCSKMSSYLQGGIAPKNGPMLLPWWYLPVKNWHYLDVACKNSWTDPCYIEGYPTLFDILRSHKIRYSIQGMNAQNGSSLPEINKYRFDTDIPWTLFFIGDIDLLSHHHYQESEVVRERLRVIDRVIQEKYELLKEKFGNFDFIIFSDHGHVSVTEHINLKDVFYSCGDRLDNYIYFLDANFARFWFRNDEEERNVRSVLATISNKGFILTKEYCRTYHIDELLDIGYGDVIFYIDEPFHLTVVPNIAGYKLTSKFVSMHGYTPDNPGCDGMFVSSIEPRAGAYVNLVDIMPSVLSIFDIEIPSNIDGKSIWK